MIVDKFRHPGRVFKRFVRKACYSPGLYLWCEQSADNRCRDVAQGYCDATDLPDDIRDKCDTYEGSFYACEWPL